MNGWIRVGAQRAAELPAGRLSDEERNELQRLLGLRERLAEQSRLLEQQIELLLLACRDRRGLAGRVEVDPASGVMRGMEEVTDGD